MKSLKRINIFIVVISLLSFIKLEAQSLSTFEGKHSVLNKKSKIYHDRLDSLKKLLEYKNLVINKEKNKDESDIDLVKKMLAEAGQISDYIEDAENKLKLIDEELENVKKIIIKSYNNTIDSLKAAIEKSPNSNLARINKQLVEITEKKMVIAPKVSALKFNPATLLKMQINKSDDIEKRIYKEYITDALEEVNQHLATVEKLKKEADNLQYLLKKTESFVEDSEFDLSTKLFGNSNFNTSMSVRLDGLTANTDKGVETSGSTNYYYSNILSYSAILSQLSTAKIDENQRWQTAGEIFRKGFNIVNYTQFLKEVSKQLKEYKMVLTSKIEGVK